MNARDVVGRRIVAVEQGRRNAREYSREMVTVLDAMVLDDGTRVSFATVETDFGEYWVEGVAYKPERTTMERGAIASPPGLLSPRELCARLGLSMPTIWRMRKRGELPEPIQLSPGRKAWRAEVIDGWLAAREATKA